VIVGATNERLQALLDRLEVEIQARLLLAASAAPQLELLRDIRIAAELWRAPENAGGARG
jgi:hypothetical protein